MSGRLGCFYLGTFFPAKILLPDGALFSFEKDSVKLFIVIHRHLKSLVINDYGNRIKINAANQKLAYSYENTDFSISDSNLHVSNDDGGHFLIDHYRHLHKELFTLNHTEVVVFFETKEDAENAKIATDALMHFIRCYRVVSNDVLTIMPEKMAMFSSIYKHYFHPYTDQELTEDMGKRVIADREFVFRFDQFKVPFWRTQSQTINVDQAIVMNDLKYFLDQKKEIDLVSEYAMRASEELHVHDNPKYSLIESWTALEIAVVAFLTEKKKQKGISNKKMKQFEKDIPISYLINIELPLVAHIADEEFNKMVTKMNSVRSIRNAVIHKNKTVSTAEAEEALNTLYMFLKFIGHKKY